MIRLSCLFVVLWGCLASGVVAAQATVRSGEHGAFTRLVVDLPQASKWSIRQNGDQAILRIEKGVSGFDFSQVYRRIARDRIQLLAQGERASEMRMQLGCDCSLSAFLADDRMLVIDVSERVGDPVRVVAPKLPRLSFGVEAEIRLADQIPLFFDDAILDRPQAGFEIDIEAASQRQGITRIAEEKLLRQIGRAATQGLLEPAGPLRVEPAQTAVREAAIKAAPPDEIPGVPVRATTGQDAAFDPRNTGDTSLITGAECQPDDDFAIAEWGGKTFDEGLAYWRSRLYGEFDEADQEAITGLARHYVHYGFGAEARQIMALSPEIRPVLMRLSRIVDELEIDDSDWLLTQSECEGRVALWAVLAMPDNRFAADVNEEAVARHFNDLPQHLREHLGPELARRLLALGYKESASRILRRLDLAKPVTTPSAALARAELDEKAGSRDSAQAIRREVIATNSVHSPVAFTRMISDEIAEGRRITPETADLAAAYAFEQRKSDLGDLMAWTEVLARAGAQQFDLAFERFEMTDARADPERSAKLFMLLQQNADDATFLRLLLPRVDAAQKLEAVVGNRVAQRLVKLGLPEHAQIVLRDVAAGDAGRTRRLLRAKVSLALQRPRQAEAELLALSGPDVDRVRAEARSMSGDHAVAMRVFSVLEAEDERDEQAFLAGEWDALAGGDDPVLSSLARLKLESDSDEQGEDGVLARNHALLSESAETRATLTRVLEAYGLTEADDGE